MNELKYYKTPRPIAMELFRCFSISDVETIIDVGAGEGALLGGLPVASPHKKIAIEINESNLQCLEDIYDLVYIADVFKSDINLINSTPEKVLFISNPPFGETPHTKKLRRLMNASGLFNTRNKKSTYRMELVFIARVLKAAKAGDQAGFIVPVSLVSQRRFTQVRRELVRNHGLYACVLIPGNVFRNTEVETAIIWFRPFSGTITESVKVFKQSSIEPEMVPLDEFVNTGLQNKLFNEPEKDTLGAIILNMKRGASSKKSLLDRGIKHIHTSDLNQKHASVVKMPRNAQDPVEDTKERYAEDGDILMARVGTRVVGKTAIFSGTKAVISDCVIRIRVADRDRNEIFKKLVSPKGQRWLKGASTGSCARLLSYNVLNKFPLINEY